MKAWNLIQRQVTLVYRIFWYGYMFSLHCSCGNSMHMRFGPASESLVSMFERHIRPIAMIKVFMRHGLAPKRAVLSAFLNFTSSSTNYSSSMWLCVFYSSFVWNVFYMVIPFLILIFMFPFWVVLSVTSCAFGLFDCHLLGMLKWKIKWAIRYIYDIEIAGPQHRTKLASWN